MAQALEDNKHRLVSAKRKTLRFAPNSEKFIIEESYPTILSNGKMTRSELVQITYLALEFIAQEKMWSFGLQITNHILGMRPIFNLKPGLHDES